MQDNKYYVPTIEEFHVGFEYELFEDFDTLPEKTWHKQIYGKNGCDPESMDFVSYKNIERKEIRVPYLTKEDIEAEGFKMKFPISASGDTYFENGKVTIWCNFHKHTIRVIYNDDGNNIVLFQSLADSDIKNRSEFKRTLKMIGV